MSSTMCIEGELLNVLFKKKKLCLIHVFIKYNFKDCICFSPKKNCYKIIWLFCGWGRLEQITGICLHFSRETCFEILLFELQASTENKLNLYLKAPLEYTVLTFVISNVYNTIKMLIIL